jgi:nucleoside-diphosphate-sugar epimerase
VGGIHANNVYPAEFIQQNLTIAANVIHEAWRGGVEQLLFLVRAASIRNSRRSPSRNRRC